MLSRFILCLIASLGIATAEPATAKLDLSSRLEAQFAVGRAAERLAELQAADGTWAAHPGITALCAIALHRMPDAASPNVANAIARALPAIRNFADTAPTATTRDTTHVYSCAASQLALLALSEDKVDKARAKALANYLEDFLNRKLGSAAILAKGGIVDMPDVSNLHWAIDAILLSRQDELPRSLSNRISRFLEASQATSPPAQGGFAYAPIRKGMQRPVWGSVTWAAIRALVLTGYPTDSPAVVGGRKWLGENFSSSENPGLRRGGYYYYLYLSAGTNLLLEHKNTPPVPSNWRQQIVDQLLSTQNGDGTWTNDSAIWLENRKPLATAYAILVLTMASQ